jgi:hypothetical protein
LPRLKLGKWLGGRWAGCFHVELYRVFNETPNQTSGIGSAHK